MAFQAAEGLTSDGIVGRRTWAALEEARNPRPARTASTKSLREAGSRTIAAADATQVSSAAQTVGGVGGVLAALQADLEGVTGIAWLPEILAGLGIAIAVLGVWNVILSARVKAARVDDAVTARNLGR